MMKWLLMALALAIPTVAAAQSRGDWVLSQWRGSRQYFPGVVQSRHGDTLVIRFDDGSVYDVHVGQVRPYDWRVGSRVECLWTDGSWYGAVITAMARDGLTIAIRYDDNVEQQTQTGRCRSL